MTIAVVETRMPTEPPAGAEEPSWDELLRAWQQLDVPDGWRAEVLGRGITVVPPPGGAHNVCADYLHWTLRSAAPEDCVALQTQGMCVPERGRLLVPDLMIIPRDAVPLDATPAVAEDTLIVVEITSRFNAEDDRGIKLRGYAAGGVPLYLLVDSWDPDGSAVTLYADPRNGAYRHSDRVAFGEKIGVPDPFGVDLDTSQLVTARRPA